MGGNDDDKRSGLDRLWDDAGKELANTRKELERVMEEMRGQLTSPDDVLKELRKQRDSDDVSQRGTFERFKGFIDSNLAVISDSFTKFPSNVKELKDRMQEERQARRAQELDIWRRWTGSEDSPDHIRLQVERASKDDKAEVTSATFMLLRESFERNKHVSAQKILDLYRDDDFGFGSLDQFAAPMLSFGGACYYKPETVENLPSTARWGLPLATQRWLSVDWFKRSQYSPIRLEAHPDLASKGEKWRAAFEDLLLVSLDKPMQTTERVGQRMPKGKPQSTYHGPGLDWMLSLQCRGILPPQLPNLYRQYRHETERQWLKPAHTRVLPDLQAITSQRSHCMYPHAEADIQALKDEVGIQAQPEYDAFSQIQPAPIPQSPWQVPDTEAELYEQMQPRLPFSTSMHTLTGRKSEDNDNVREALADAINDRDFLSGINSVRDYERLHGKSDALLDDLLLFMDEPEIQHVRSHLLENEDDYAYLKRFGERVDLQRQWTYAFERAEELGVDVASRHASGASLEEVMCELDGYELTQRQEKLSRQQRTDIALARAENLGYDFTGWDWANLPLEELEAELEREENYTSARRREVLAKAARLGYDFDGWLYQGLPVQELEDEMLRMEEYARRDAMAAPYLSLSKTAPEEAKRPDVLSQLTTTETTRLPDGTVTTKVVLKRRFVDGREETKESVHTSNEELEAQAAEKAKEKSEKEKSKGKGWFWN